MDTKKAIDRLEDCISDFRAEGNIYVIKEFNQIISLLQQGKKYRLMWKEFYKVWGEYPIELHNIAEFMDDIKQKHFPKED